MLKIEYFHQNIPSTLEELLAERLRAFEVRNGVSLTIHAMSGRWYGAGGVFLFSAWSAHRADYCRFQRYVRKRYNRQCLRDCAQEVEQASQQRCVPFRHNCWKGVSELVVPLVWGGVLELVFYIGPFRGGEPPDSDLRDAWAALPDYPSAGRAATLAGECQELGLALYLRLRQEQEGQPEGGAPGRREVIREYILCHGCGEITLEGLARYLHVSVSRASHLCLALVGVPFQTQVLTLRMKTAQRLLLQTDEPIKAIATKTGFVNVFYFTRRFTAFFGESPAKFRARGTAS